MRWALLGPMWPYRGGIAHFSAALARALVARGHEVRPLTFRRQYPDRLFPGTSQFEDGPPPEGVPAASRLLDTLSPASWRRTARAVTAWPADVLVVPYWMAFFAPALGAVARLARRRGVRVLTVVHNAIGHEPRPGERALARWALGASDALVTLSPAVTADVRALGVSVPVVETRHPIYDFGRPVGRDEARRALGLPPDAPTLLFFGFVRRYKGLHVLLDAMPRVLAAHPDARLVVAGEFYADEDALREQAAALGPAVRFDAHYISDGAIATYFGAADAVVQPYVSATQSGVAQIARHFGRPLVTTRVGALADDVRDGETGLVVPPDDPAALADALVRLFGDGLAERLADGVRAEGRRTGWDDVAALLERLAARDVDASDPRS